MKNKTKDGSPQGIHIYLFLIVASLLGSFYLRLGIEFLLSDFLPEFFWVLSLALIIKPLVYRRFRLFDHAGNPVGIKTAKRIVIGVTSASALLTVFTMLLFYLRVFAPFSRSTLFIDWILSLIAVFGWRLFTRLLAVTATIRKQAVSRLGQVMSKIVLRAEKMFVDYKKIWLALFSLAGLFLIGFSTSGFGAGLSPDSAHYIGAARNLMAGKGLLSYTGSPITTFPPIYPILLSLGALFSGRDPSAVAHYVNAVFFGGSVYLAGLLLLEYTKLLRSFVVLVTATVLFSYQLFEVTLWALSDTLFIFLTLQCLVFANIYIKKNNIATLLGTSVFVALAILTRYVGVFLVIWGIILISFNRNLSFQKRVIHLISFLTIAILPLAVWVLRNYALSGTLFGSRAAIYEFSFVSYLHETFRVLSAWFVPVGLEIPFLVAILLLVAVVIGNFPKTKKEPFFQPQPLFSAMLFILCFYGLLIAVSKVSSISFVDGRYLSPIYLPIIIVAISFISSTIGSLRKGYLRGVVVLVSMLVWVAWFSYSLTSTLSMAREVSKNGLGYGGAQWRLSSTINWLKDMPGSVSGCPLYSNAYDALYLVANISARRSPARFQNDGQAIALLSLKDQWPQKGRACLIWIEGWRTDFLFSPEELATIANITVISSLEDGVVYSVSRK